MRLKRTGILTKIVIAVLVVYAVVSLIRISDRRAEAQSELDDLRRQQAAIAAENDDMLYAINNKDDPDVIRDIARDELGMIDPGEEIYSSGK